MNLVLICTKKITIEKGTDVSIKTLLDTGHFRLASKRELNSIDKMLNEVQVKERPWDDVKLTARQKDTFQWQ